MPVVMSQKYAMPVLSAVRNVVLSSEITPVRDKSQCFYTWFHRYEE